MRKLLFLLALSFTGVTLLLSGVINPMAQAFSNRTHLTGLPSARAADIQDYHIYIPNIVNNHPLDTLFGVGLNQISTAGGLDALTQTHSSWIRKDGVRWYDVEPTKGVRNWEVLNNLNIELLAAAQNHQRVVMIVQGTPAWAAIDDNTTCGPIKREELATFANFMHELVLRYSGHPYYVKNWEIWNEPDTDALDSVEGFGCWGDANDEYFGGGYYAEMLGHVYTAIKSADPYSKVIVGGLLLDCHPDLCVTPAQSDKPPKFLEGILKAGGGSFFDGISFHAYDYYYGNGSYGNPNWGTTRDSGGPVSSAKAAYIRGLLNQYGVTGKFLMNTESALICDGASCSNPLFELVKAAYVVQTYAVAAAQDFEANLWYNMFGWRNSGLLDGNLIPRDAYRSFKFASEKLGGAAYAGKFVDSNLEGYEFRKGSRRILVVWSKDGAIHPLSMTPVQMYDVFGNITLDTQIGTIPVYIELNL